jgi:CheY-like chemotaxis protein
VKWQTDVSVCHRHAWSEAIVSTSLGAQSQRVYDILLRHIRSGELRPGAQFPNINALAHEYGVSSVTVRTAMDRLEDAGLVRRRRGVGTFVETPPGRPTILIVDDEPAPRSLLSAQVQAEGFQTVEAQGPQEAMALLDRGPLPTMLLSDVRMPRREDGVRFVLSVRRRWPDLPVAVVTGFSEDLNEARLLPEWPIIEFSKPVTQEHLGHALRLVTRREAGATTHARRPVLIAVDESEGRALLETQATESGYDVDVVPTIDDAIGALAHRDYGHVFVSVGTSPGQIQRVRDLASAHPDVALIACLPRQQEPMNLGGLEGMVLIAIVGPPSPTGVAEALRIRRVTP